MRDMISCEEVFELDADARAEFEFVCDEWNEEAIEAQEKQLKAIERRRKLKQIWESIHPIDRPTWEQWKRGMVTLPQTPRDRDFPIAAMEDRKRRAKEWAEHMAKKS